HPPVPQPRLVLRGGDRHPPGDHGRRHPRRPPSRGVQGRPAPAHPPRRVPRGRPRRLQLRVLSRRDRGRPARRPVAAHPVRRPRERRHVRRPPHQPVTDIQPKPSASPMPDMPQPGDVAPDFEGPTQSGDTLRLSDLRGRPVAVYFYPKDDTPGCTRQACNLRDNDAALTEAGVAVVGVSPDPVERHADFAAKYALPFPLVADPDHAIAERYGVWGERVLYGRRVTGLKRTTVLVGPDGRVVDVIRRPNVDDHAAEVLARFRKA